MAGRQVAAGHEVTAHGRWQLGVACVPKRRAHKQSYDKLHNKGLFRMITHLGSGSCGLSHESCGLAFGKSHDATLTDLAEAEVFPPVGIAGGCRGRSGWSSLEAVLRFYGRMFPHTDAERRRSLSLNLHKCRKNLLLGSKVMPVKQESVREQNYSQVTCAHGAWQLPRVSIHLCCFFTGTFDPQ